MRGEAEGRRWFFYFVRMSLLQRRLRIGVACLAVIVGVGLSSALITISLGIRERLGEELKAYGANMMIIQREGGYLNEEDIPLLNRVGGRIENPQAQLYGQATIGGRTVELIGVDIEPSTGMRLYGDIPSYGEAMAGTILQDRLRLSIGSVIELTSEGRRGSFRISGFFERGGPEDKAIIVRLKDAQRILGLDKGVSAILLRGKGNLESLRRDIEGLIPYSKVKTLRQVAEAEASLLEKVEFLMALVSIVVLFAVVLSIGSTMNATLLERRREIGLMKALGGTKGSIRNLFLAEALFIGGLGGIVGLPVGVVVAEIVSKGAFGRLVGVPWHLPIISILLGIFLGFSSSLLPLRGAIRLEPAITLRGE